MNESVDFSPLRNGLDYLEDAVERLCGTPNSSDLKYAVLHLHAGIEVLLKHRLIHHDWRLVLADGCEDTTRQQFDNGNFRSVGAGTALRRLQDDVGIKLSKGQKKAAVAVERLRNQLQHHGLISTRQAIEAQSAKALGFILDFLDQHVGAELHFAQVDRELLDGVLPSIRLSLGKIEKFVDYRMERLLPALSRRCSTERAVRLCL